MWPKYAWPLSHVRPFERVEIQHGDRVQFFEPEKNPRDVDGPAVDFIHPDGMVLEFERVMLTEQQIGWLYDETGEYREVKWPAVIHVHPNGRFVAFERKTLSEKEAMVVIEQDGKENIILWKEKPALFINPVQQRVKKFRWTGSASGPDSDKVPWALNFEVLRLGDSQTYFSFPVRTRDNAMVTVKLMIFYGIDDVTKLVQESHDPFCEFFNKIQAAVTDEVAKLSFDEFKQGTGQKITEMGFFTQKPFESLGIRIDSVSLREWEPVDKNVQRVLEQAAIVQTQKSLDTAEHERTMAKIGYEETQLTSTQQLATLRQEESKQAGIKKGIEMTALIEELKKVVDPAQAVALMKLHLASQAQELNIGSNMLQ